MTVIADQAARSQALNSHQSFIVQAPAGSGKTGLLVQRFLVLLATVETPEEIIAITFTRKAASEMQQRILEALEQAENQPQPREDYALKTWKIAHRALARDHEKNWQLLNNPTRLRIQTIDSLSASLVQQMPLLSHFGATPAITEDAEALYLEAAKETLAALDAKSDWSDGIAHLIRHMDNRLEKLQKMLADMLKQRDQWLRHVADREHPKLEKKALESAMARLVMEALQALQNHAPTMHEAAITQLGRFAASHLQDHSSAIDFCENLTAYPITHLEARPAWEGLAELLLTKKGEWRKAKGAGIRQGFPPVSQATNKEEKTLFKTMKQRLQVLLEALHEETEFREALALLPTLPAHQYSDSEWKTLQALIDLLPLAVANLTIVFSQQETIDFPALTLASSVALGGEESPTDLALALDYRIHHLLVDEFQDTSFNQFQLLERLTAGWQPNDGRSLFLVGDPMQSIYRFREAEVGLFLQVCQQGLGQLPLEFLQLTVNFRSQQGIVDWINQTFPHVLPCQNNIANGAVTYAPSTAYHPPINAPSVTVHPYFYRDDAAEAEEVVNIIQQNKNEQRDHGTTGTIAVLVRGRNHLNEIIKHLKQATIPFQAVDIERLTHRPIIQDLLALTRALTHTGDRIAWLAVLRAPFCGLTLADLYALVTESDNPTPSNKTLIDLLRQENRIQQLSIDGQQRIARILPLLETILSEQSRCSLRSYVEGAWIALGGPACVLDETDLEDAAVYFQRLDALNHISNPANIDELSKQIEKLFALPDVQADSSLQLMTVHKSKGLEFDTVILPGLGREPPPPKSKLLTWLERQSHGQRGADLLLAPISAYGEDKNPMAVFLQAMDKQKGEFEDGRLLYVAATRAKNHLYILGHTKLAEKDGQVKLNAPAQNSLLARWWPAVSHEFQTRLDNTDATEHVPPNLQTHTAVQARLRLDAGWSPPPPSVSTSIDTAKYFENEDIIEFDWAGEIARHVGTVVHRFLQNIGERGIENCDKQERHRLQKAAHTMLQQLGVASNRLAQAAAQVALALHAVFEDPRGQWILSHQHTDIRCEWALSCRYNNTIKHMVIDRTFVDAQGERWIIDYKTGSHQGDDVENFLDQEQKRYRQQLEEYAYAIHMLNKKPIRLGLYFPLIRGWRTWSC